MRHHLLGITIVLLGLTATQISAQERNGRKTLEGLREIGIVVTYRQADGLEETMRPTILKMLQDRATNRLREAKVPLLPSSAQGDMVGGPRLVFTVSVNKLTDTAPAIQVETKVYQRVHLWRDPSKEMELATWDMNGIGGPKVTMEMLFDVFDEQIDQFVKNYRAMNPNPSYDQSHSIDYSAKATNSENALQGLNGIKLFVSFRRDQLADDRHQVLLKMLEDQGRSKLAKAGIPLLKTSDQTELAGHPLLYVLITLSQPNFHAPAINVESEFFQRVRLVRDSRKHTDAVTWASRASDIWPITDEAVLGLFNRQLDEFIKAYNAVNPQLSSVPN